MAAHAPVEGGSQAATPAMSRLEKKMHVRQLDIKRKQQHRQDTKKLMQTLAELEAKERGEKGPVKSRDAVLNTVLERVTKRLRVINAERCEKKVGDVAEGGAGSLTHADVVAGMVGARSLGTLYVCVEDWVVRSSNRAMELMCPYELLRGYVGLELPGVVHPDDHLQLELLQKEQVHSFQPGDSLALSVRMLRACEDRGTLVVAWRRQILEVAHVGRDEEHGGKIHVMFTCVLEAESLEPLVFDDSDRRLFHQIAQGVSGTYALDPHRTTQSMDELSQMMSNVGFTDRSEASPVADLGSRLSHSLGRFIGIPQLLASLKRGAVSALNHLVHFNSQWGLAPDGTPWLQLSARLSTFGLSSGYHTFVTRSLSGSHSTKGIDSIAGVFKPHECEAAVEGGAAIGNIYLHILTNHREAPAQTRRIISHGQAVFTHDAQNQAGYERTLLNFYDSELRDGALPQRHHMHSTRTGPPDAGLLEKFLMFGPERVATMFPEFCS